MTQAQILAGLDFFLLCIGVLSYLVRQLLEWIATSGGITSNHVKALRTWDEKEKSLVSNVVPSTKIVTYEV